MEFLGSLGIDIKLLLAQIVNFTVLLWLLAKFLYKPIIKHIEKDEAELQQARIQKKALEQEKEKFLQQKRSELVEAKKQSQKIIEEAETIAKEIKDEEYKKTKKEAAIIITQAKKSLRFQKPAFEKEIVKDLKVKISNNFRTFFKKSFSLSSQKEIQNIFWSNLLVQIKALPFEKRLKENLTGILEKFNTVTRKDGGKKDELEWKLKKIIAQKMGLVVLEYVYSLTERQEDEIEEVVAKKTGLKLRIVKKQNDDLINGFRFEIMGVILESNLLNIIHNAASFKQ